MQRSWQLTRVWQMEARVLLLYQNEVDLAMARDRFFPTSPWIYLPQSVEGQRVPESTCL